MKKGLIAVVLLCLLSFTACGRENVSEQSAQVTKQEDTGKVIRFGKEETGLLELGNIPVVCEFDSGEKQIEVKYYKPDYEADMEDEERQLLRPDAQIKIDDVWIRPVEMEYWPGKIYVGNLTENGETTTYFFVEHSDDSGINARLSVFFYNDRELEKIGEIPGNGVRGHVIKDSNDEIRSTNCVFSVVEMGYYEGVFKLNGGEIEEVEKDFYDILPSKHENIGLVREILVYEEPDSDSNQFIMKPQMVSFTKTDTYAWLEIEAEDGTKGYLWADAMTLPDMDDRDATDFFEGLYCWNQPAGKKEIAENCYEGNEDSAFMEIGSEPVRSGLFPGEVKAIYTEPEEEGFFSDLQFETDKIWIRPIEMKYYPQKAYTTLMYDSVTEQIKTVLFVEHKDDEGEEKQTTALEVASGSLREITVLPGWISTCEILKCNMDYISLSEYPDAVWEDVEYELRDGKLEQMATLPEGKYYELEQILQDDIYVHDGEAYNCDIAIEVYGHMYIYEFPNFDEAEEFGLIYDYENMVMSQDVCCVPVFARLNQEKYLIGEARIYYTYNTETDEYEMELMYYYEDDGVNYRKGVELCATEGAIIRAYHPEDRTVEICFVTLVDYDTSVGYEIEKEEWITVPLAEDAKYVSWSLSCTSDSYITEEVLAEKIVEGAEREDYFFSYVNVEDDVITGISEVLNP